MLKQQLNLKLSQKLSPQQIQLMKLIQLPTMAFEQRIKQELEDNPALDSGKEASEEKEFEDEFSNETTDEDINREEPEIDIDDYLSDDDIPDYKLRTNNYSSDDEDKHIPYAAGKSFAEHLKTQLQTYRLDSEEKKIAEFLIGSVDDSGYIRRAVNDIVDDMAFTQNIYTDAEAVERMLKIVQSLDPSGVGARDLQECLLIQLRRRPQDEITKFAIAVLEDSFDAFAKKHYDKLLSKYDIDEDRLRDVIEEVSSLNPKPGGSYSNNIHQVEHVIPDFTIRIKDGELELTLNGRNAPELHISPHYREMLKGYKEASKTSQDQKNAVLFIKQKLDSAKWFIDAILQRQQTLYVTMDAIMNYQEDYFLSGDERDLKPMILKDIAERINMDVSTVSRVANSKYVDTPYGTLLIKDLFSESMTNVEGEEVSTREIKKILEMTVEKEDKRKPLTDEKLAAVLKEKGYPIARRTIAKYREQLDIPVARLRKEL